MTNRPRVVIVGGGFAGLSVARHLSTAAVDLTLIDRRNYHLFQPLLYQVATSALGPADVASPIRNLTRNQKNLTVFWDEVIGVNREERQVSTAKQGVIDYDYLVVATGAQHSYFGKDKWAENAPGLKSIEDAYVLRHRILGAFEQAEMETDPEKRAPFLEFVVVGAGPTGVEMAGALSELARHSLVNDFRTITPKCARVKLVEAGPRILPAFSEALAKSAANSLKKMGVEVLTNTRVTDIGESHVVLDDRALEARTIIWAAGVKASPAATWLHADQDRSGRAIVDDHLRASCDSRTFVIGDTAAHIPQGAERALPGLAPVAKQMGKHVAQVIAAEVECKAMPKSFKYRDWGNLAIIGRNKAIVQMGPLKASGFFAWIIWSLVHVAFLDGFRNRVSVGLSWAWSYVTWQRGARLIIGLNGKSTTEME